MSLPSPEPQAAVAIIRTRNLDPEYLIIKRTVNPKDPWSGHFAFPGGGRDKNDPDLLATCLREVREECGLQLHPRNLKQTLPITHAGRLTEAPIFVSPFLFEIPMQVPLTVDPKEIDRYLWLPATYLKNKDNHSRQSFLKNSPQQLFHCIKLEDGYIWGFTYRVLADILQIHES